MRIPQGWIDPEFLQQQCDRLVFVMASLNFFYVSLDWFFLGEPRLVFHNKALICFLKQRYVCFSQIAKIMWMDLHCYNSVPLDERPVVVISWESVNSICIDGFTKSNQNHRELLLQFRIGSLHHSTVVLLALLLQSSLNIF